MRAKGAAPLDNQSRGAARLQAIQDAERQASETPGLRISGSSQPDGQDTTQAEGVGHLGETVVTGESASNGVLRIDTKVGVNPQGSCPAGHYRKKLAVSNFMVAHPEQTPDIQNAGQGFAMELLRTLEAGHRFKIRNAVNISIFPDPNLAPAVDSYGDPRAVAALGRKVDAQFVLAGAILDLSADRSYYNQFADEITTLFGVHTEPYKRGLRVGLYVFDGLTGNTLLQQTYEQTIYGDVSFPGGIPFGSREFQESDLGEAVREIIGQQIADISAKLNCLPLMERIVRVEKPFVYINAGSESNLRVGDSLAVYHQLDKPLPGIYYQNDRLLGYSEELKTTLTITQVQPSFAIGRLESASARVEPMDLVRSW